MALAGCGPTFPKEKFKEAIVKMCHDEYKLDVKVATSGKTIAIYVPLENLIDFTFSITKSAGEKINNVILSVSRVALSSDAKFDFYCVIAHDVRLPEIQIVIIKSVDDVKRFLLNDISRGEYAKRMIIDIRFSPQAQKEKAIKDVFEKMSLDKKTQDDIMGDFFRSSPTILGDIGYWNGRFYIKDVTMQEFLSEQMAGRIKMAFHEDKGLAESFLLKASKGTYATKDGKLVFTLTLQPEFRLIGAPKEGDIEKIAGLAIMMAADTLHGYRFKDFDHVEIAYYKGREPLKISPEELENFRKKKIKIDYFLNVQK
jgi:hypothetical protein